LTTTEFEKYGKGGNQFHIACGTRDSVPLSLILVYKNAQDFDKCLVLNNEIAGDNAGRVSLIAPLAAVNVPNLSTSSPWVSGLTKSNKIS